MSGRNPEQESDEALVARANAGDVAAFEALYFRHRDWSIRTAARFLSEPHHAPDVAQEVFLWLLRQFPGFNLRAQLRTVLYPAIRNAAVTLERKRGVRLRHAERIRRQAEPLAVRPGDDERLALLTQALGELGEIHREIIHLRYADEMDIAEIALALEIPEGTVKSRLHHALAALRRGPLKKIYFEE